MSRRNSFVMIIICVSLLISMASGLVISPVCTKPSDQVFPAISGATIVWQDYRNGNSQTFENSDIYKWDPVHGEQPVVIAPDDQSVPAISGDIIVWQDDRNHVTTDEDIYKWDPVNGVKAVCTEPHYQGGPAISGDTIVWADLRNLANEIDIYKWDPVLGDQPVCTAAHPQSSPAVSGDTIVWADQRNFATSGEDIYKWDPLHGEQSVVIAPYDQRFPEISGDTIVWADHRNSATTGWDIYKWDPVNGEQSVCTKPGDQEYPAISGNTIVWMDNRNLATTGWDIYKWDPVNGEQSVCIDPGYQEYPAISGNIIVWMDNRNLATTGWDIYMAITPPIANAGPDQTVIVNEPVTFDGSGSWSDGTIVSYAWDFSVPPSGGMKPSHTYTAAGTYTVTLTVIDDDGLTDSDNVKITVNTLTKSIQDLRVKVVSLKLPALIEKGLTDKLDASNLQINKMQYSAAKQSLTAFTYQVKAQTGKANNLNQATAYELITTAQRIINSIPKK